MLINENISELFILQMAENKSAFNESNLTWISLQIKNNFKFKKVYFNIWSKKSSRKRDRCWEKEFIRKFSARIAKVPNGQGGSNGVLFTKINILV